VTDIDPLSVKCGYCTMPPGEPCTSLVSNDGRVVRPHRDRKRLALAVAAHADPALDAWPQLGPLSPCGICGVPGMPQRHRVVDAVAGHLEAGEDPEDIAAEFGFFPAEAAVAVREWAARWPGAWK
jgi:hypothetical protein